MSKKLPESTCCATPRGGFRVEAVVSVDERGQMVLPKDVRERIGVRAGEKLALVTWEKDGEVCCMSLIRTEALAGMVRALLGPMVGELAKV